jgi:hypothetical protein
MFLKNNNNNSKNQKVLAVAIALQLNLACITPAFAAADADIQTTADSGTVDLTAADANYQAQSKVISAAAVTDAQNAQNAQEQKNATTKQDLMAYQVTKSDGSSITVTKNICYNKQTSDCTTSYIYSKSSDGTTQQLPSYSQQWIASDGSAITTDMIKQVTNQATLMRGDTSGYLNSALSAISQMGKPSDAADWLSRAVMMSSIWGNYQKLQADKKTTDAATKAANEKSDKDYADKNQKISDAQAGHVSATWQGNKTAYELLPVRPTANDQDTPITISFRHTANLTSIDVTYFDKIANAVTTKTIKPDEALVLEPKGKVTNGTKTIQVVLHFAADGTAQGSTSKGTIKYDVDALVGTLTTTDEGDISIDNGIGAVVANKEIAENDNLTVPTMGLMTAAAYDDKSNTCSMVLTDDNNTTSILAKSSNIGKDTCVAGRYADMTSSNWAKTSDGTSYLQDTGITTPNSTKTYDNASDYWAAAKTSHAAYVAGSTYDPEVAEIEGNKVITGLSGNIGTDYVVVGNANIPINSNGTLGYNGQSLSNDEIGTLSNKAGLDVTKLSAVKDDNGIYTLQDNSGKVVSGTDKVTTNLNKSVSDYLDIVKANGLKAFVVKSVEVATKALPK